MDSSMMIQMQFSNGSRDPKKPFGCLLNLFFVFCYLFSSIGYGTLVIIVKQNEINRNKTTVINK
jgi:hypothetical protein